MQKRESRFRFVLNECQSSISDPHVCRRDRFGCITFHVLMVFTFTITAILTMAVTKQPGQHGILKNISGDNVLFCGSFEISLSHACLLSPEYSALRQQKKKGEPHIEKGGNFIARYAMQWNLLSQDGQLVEEKCKLLEKSRTLPTVIASWRG